MLATTLKRLACVSALLACAGCGSIGLQISGFPDNARPGQPVDFTVKLTNHGLCPVDSLVTVVPFLTDAQILSATGSAGPIVIQLLCNGGISSGGQQCTLSGDIITCNFPVATIPLGAPAAPTQQNFSLTLPGLPEPIPCTQSGSVLQCQIPAADRQALSFANSPQHASLPSSGAPVSCAPSPPTPESVSCLVPPLDAGAMTTFDVTLNAPLGQGTFRTFAAVEQTDGVCQGVATANTPCSVGGTDCGTGTCQSSICTSGTDAGFGCALDTDCAGGGTGSCQPCFTEGTDTLVTPAGCATTFITLEAAPVASRTGLLMLTGALFVVGAFWLGLRRRRTE